MIIKEDGKATCHYNENENLPNIEGVGISMQTYMANRGEICDRVGHHNFRADLPKHVFCAWVYPDVDDFDVDKLFNSTDDESEMFKGDSGEDFNDVASNDD